MRGINYQWQISILNSLHQYLRMKICLVLCDNVIEQRFDQFPSRFHSEYCRVQIIVAGPRVAKFISLKCSVRIGSNIFAEL